MRKWKVSLLIALGILGGLVAWALLGRNVWNATTTPVGSAAPGSATQERAIADVCRCDTSGHKVSFVTVESMLSASRIEVSGGSSQPAHGYDVDTRARDDITVLDKLNIREAVFVGHSLSGTELNKIGAVYPDRVKKLVYLDALDNGSDGWTSLPQPPPPPEDTPADLESVERFAAASARFDGYRKPLAAICNMIRTDPSGRVIGAITPLEISRKIYAGLQPAEYDRIQAPVLGIFNKITPQYRLPYYWYLDSARQEEFNRNIEALAKWIEGAIQRFRSGVKNSRVIELHDTNHYVFIVDEALVVRETRKFLLDE
jgi:non-heme chloroperoxidase